MEAGKLFSVMANDGILSLASVLVVLLVLRWALRSPAWNVQDELGAAPAGGAAAGAARSGASLPTPAGWLPAVRPSAETGGATSPLPRVAGQYGGQPAGRADGLIRRPNVSGGPPWGPAPRPPALRS
jgi:hypothetical protein